MPKHPTKSPAAKSPITRRSKTHKTNYSVMKPERNLQKVTLQGLECYNNMYLGWLECGPIHNVHGYYVKPIDEAWNVTVMDSVGEAPSPLYPTPPNQSTKNIIDIFQVDYWTERRAEIGSPCIKQTVAGKSFPFRTFIWVRPPIEEDSEKGTWTINHWLEHLKGQIMQFMDWTRINPQTYSSFRFPCNMIAQAKSYISPLADEILDNAVIVVIKENYTISNINDILNSTNEEDSIRLIFFGKEVTVTEFQQRMRNAWNNVYGEE